MTGRARALWAFAVTSVAVFMVALDNLVVTTALPVIRRDLGASLSGLEWTVNGYTLTFAVLLLTGAALGDRFGRRRVFALGLVVFTAGSAAAALVPSVGWLIAARALQGLGGALVTPLSLTILSSAVAPRRRGLALGAWGRVSGLAVASGPLVVARIARLAIRGVPRMAPTGPRPGQVSACTRDPACPVRVSPMASNSARLAWPTTSRRCRRSSVASFTNVRRPGDPRHARPSWIRDHVEGVEAHAQAVAVIRASTGVGLRVVYAVRIVLTAPAR
jgi:Major Facilitator Superfamily